MTTDVSGGPGAFRRCEFPYLGITGREAEKYTLEKPFKFSQLRR
jgi:hypothetical protein